MTQPIHQHALAYLLGLEGVALMRAFAGEHDQAFTEARFAEIRSLLDRVDELGPGVDVPPFTTQRGYDGWARTYDGEENGAFPLEDDAIAPILAALAPGLTVDAACGTGRTSAKLVALGHTVVGFDTSPGMLARAVPAVPDATFAEAPIDELPLADASVDHVVITLSLSHSESVAPFFAEAARVLRPGGHLVISDHRGQFIGSPRYPLVEVDLEGHVGYVASDPHAIGDYLRAGLAHGFTVRACEEVNRTALAVDPDDEREEPWDRSLPPDIWALHSWVPEAANAARNGLPVLVIWDFELVTVKSSGSSQEPEDLRPPGRDTRIGTYRHRGVVQGEPERRDEAGPDDPIVPPARTPSLGWPVGPSRSRPTPARRGRGRRGRG